MDFFTKNKMLFWCVIILIVLNAVTLTTFWMKNPLLEPHKSGPAATDGLTLMAERLQLSPEQTQQIKRIRDEHFMRTRPIQDDMHKIRLDLLHEIFAPEPDEELIQTWFTELGENQTRFEKNLYRHFQELKDVCTAEQMQELQIMLRDLIERTRPRGPERPSRGLQGGMPPEDQLEPPRLPQ